MKYVRRESTPIQCAKDRQRQRQDYRDGEKGNEEISTRLHIYNSTGINYVQKLIN